MRHLVEEDEEEEDDNATLDTATLGTLTPPTLNGDTRQQQEVYSNGVDLEPLELSVRRVPPSHHNDDDEPDGLFIQDNAIKKLEEEQRHASSDFWHTFAGVAGNVLEWYDFAVFGYLGDVLGQVFFPPDQPGKDSATIEAFAVFGGAFLMRPVGGVLMGYIGDVYGRDRALILSIFLMAFPTFFMGCLPSYESVGGWAILLLIIVRLLQGLSVGGQLMSSLVFTLENHDRREWGLYGSFVMASANFGTLLGGIAGYILRATLTEEQLVAWGWRIPFLSGILVSISGLYLKKHGGESHHHHAPVDTDNDIVDDPKDAYKSKNPLVLACSCGNLRPLLSASMVPMLWAAGFYMGFVWMAIFMTDLIASPVPHAFGVNSCALLVSVCVLFPGAGALSDRIGRRLTMMIGGISLAILSPIVVMLVSRGNSWLAFIAQCLYGIALSFWGAPMCAWLVEGFEPQMRLTSVSIGYNIAQGLAGGSAPSIATLMVDVWGPTSPGFFLTGLACVSLLGLCIARPPPTEHLYEQGFADEGDAAAHQAATSTLERAFDDDDDDDLL